MTAPRGVIAWVLIALFAVPVRAQVASPKKHAPLLDGSRDRIVRSAYVPSEDQPQGEVRLIRRGSAVVMQTVLYSIYLKRVVAEIRRKERALWPATRQGRADSVRYADALAAASRRIEQRFRQREKRQDRHRKLLIEFILSEGAALVALYEPDVEKGEEHLLVKAKRPVVLLELSRAYVRGDIHEIAWDALKMTKKETKQILEPLLPAEPPGKEAQSNREEN